MTIRAVFFGARSFASSAIPQTVSPKCAVVNKLLTTLQEGIISKSPPSTLVEAVRALGRDKISSAIRDLPPERTEHLWRVSGCWKSGTVSRVPGLMLERMLVEAKPQKTEADKAVLASNGEALIKAVAKGSMVAVQEEASV